ncbi:MAG: hypothetical protein Q9215_005731 [Flavoplaca cf. flavocitrina]
METLKTLHYLQKPCLNYRNQPEPGTSGLKANSVLSAVVNDILAMEKRHPVSVMRQLVEDNNWRDYCKVFQLHGVSMNGLLAAWKPKLDEKMEKVCLEIEPRLRALGDQLPYDLQLDYSGHVARLRYGHSHLVYWLPMAILPNIETLELNDCSDFIQSLKPILKMFAKSDDEPQANLGFLPKLKEVKVTQHKPKIGPSLDVLGMFATLPTVRRLYTSNVHVSQGGNWKSDGLNWCPRDESSNVEEIQLVGGSIDAEGLTKLLKGFRALRVFSYPDNNNGRMIDNPRACLAILLRYTANTLETLTFIPGPDILRNQFEDATHEMSLKGFTNLKYAAIACSLFIRMNNIPQQRPVGFPTLDASSPRLATSSPQLMPSTTDKQTIDILSLVDVLPPSLEILHLFHPEARVSGLENAANLPENIFAGLSRTREERLPKLRCIIVQGKDRLSQRIKDECRHLGVILAFPGA